MAAKFGAKIVPFGVVGEDDVGHVGLNTISSIHPSSSTTEHGHSNTIV